ncbi:MAG: carboxypeptidase regulatory-like domain-containing protein [Proteobacteria bacterium]|nr:carboxypeptidase regulatory-like domain-containing protein [Pseudomonadota bacterium]
MLVSSMHLPRQGLWCGLWGGVATALCLVSAATVRAQPTPAVTMPAEKVSPRIAPAEVPATNAAIASRYRCGGVGSDDSDAIRAQMKEHPLSLLFARPGGAYLADIDVTIQGPDSVQALNFRANGPVCLVDLPAGSYTVHATSGGVTKKESVIVGTGPKTVDFRF